MNAVIARERWNPESAEDPLREALEVLVKSCHVFLDWQRARVLQGTPDERLMRRHRESLKRLLRMVRLFLAEVEDPEYPAPRAAAELKAVLWKLNEAWEAVHNPMSDQEYAQKINELFPAE